MSVGFGYATMCCPACVCDTNLAVEWILVELCLKLGNFSNGTTEPNGVVIIDNRDAGRIVAAIFKTPQPLDEDRNNILFGNRANDSAHLFLFLFHGALPFL